jgi:hypothetical protein
MPVHATKTPTRARIASFDHPTGTGTSLRFVSGVTESTRGNGRGVTIDGKAYTTMLMIHSEKAIT